MIPGMFIIQNAIETITKLIMFLCFPFMVQYIFNKIIYFIPLTFVNNKLPKFVNIFLMVERIEVVFISYAIISHNTLYAVISYCWNRV